MTADRRPARTAFTLTATATLLAALASAAPAAAQLRFGDPAGDPAETAPPPEERANRLVKVTATADAEAVAPGQTFHVAVRFAIEPKWHVYWRNPGDSGVATSVTVRGPAGFVIGPTRFPRPLVMREPEGVTYGYEDETVLFVPVTAPATLAPGRADFEVETFFFVCRDVCLIGRTKESVSVETIADSGGERGGAPRGDVTIERFRRRLPAPIARLEGAKARRDGDRLVVTGPARGSDALQFFPDPTPGVTFGTPAITIEGDAFRLTVPVKLEPHNSLGQRMALRGVVGLGRRLDDPSYEFNLPVDGGSTDERSDR